MKHDILNTELIAISIYPLNFDKYLHSNPETFDSERFSTVVNKSMKLIFEKCLFRIIRMNKKCYADQVHIFTKKKQDISTFTLLYFTETRRV